MKRPWLYYISPFVLAAIASLIPIAMGLGAFNKHEGYDKILLFIFFPVFLLLLGVDYFIKWITNGKILYIWIFEAILIALFFVWLSYMGSFRLSGC